MAKLTTRTLTATTVSTDNIPKNAGLTHQEMDSNFLNLNNDKLENTTDAFTGILSVQGSGPSAVGTIRHWDQDDTHYVDIKAPDNIGANYTLVLPVDDGNANEVLITDGSGNLSWSATYAGDITEVTAGNGLSGGGASGSVSLAFDITDTNITKDEDDMVSDSASHLATQQSIKAYVDSQVAATNEVVEDTTPQLGGDLDVNGQSIVTASNGNIILAPNGTGELRINTDLVEQHDTNGLIIHDQTQDGYTDAGGTNSSGLYGTGVQVEATNGAPALLLWGHKSNGAGQYPNLWAHRSRDDGAGNKDFLNTDDKVFGFFGAAWDNNTGGGNGTFRKTAGIDLVASEDHSATAGGGKIVFSTTDNGTLSYTGTTKMTIDEHVTMDSLLELKAYASGSLPTGVNGAIIAISDDSHKPAYYDGTSWKYISDNSAV